MFCCRECFKDVELRALVESGKKNGNCDFCGSKDVPVISLDSVTPLADEFEGLLEIFTPAASLPESFPRKKTDLLKNILANNWRIFNVPPDTIYEIMVNICKEKYSEVPELFDSPVGIAQNYDESFMTGNAILTNHTWDEFVQAIKWENRFHTNFINKDILEHFFRCVRKTYQKGTKFYRARICSEKAGFSCSDMGAPPKGKASAGRANSAGISVLYVADRVETTLHEIRAGAYDYVTVGTFELEKDLEVINLADLDKINPFFAAHQYGLDFLQQAVNLDSLKVIGKEIAKPLRRHDSVLDYLPTQYISDFIKSKGYAGIEYASTMCEDGINIAFFSESDLSCTGVMVYDIESLKYGYKPV